jgi:hypothetical protein
MNKQYLERAMLITGGFEGSDPWANITGNFDDAWLTCGQLGKTIRDGDQQAVVKAYIAAHGTDELLALMPETGKEYLKAINASINDGGKIVRPWTAPPRTSNVRQPYRRELAAFWKSARMVEQQVLHAEAHEAKNVDSWVSDWSGDGSFREFALFFDIAAQNGSLKGVTAEVVDSYIAGNPAAAIRKAVKWIASVPDNASGRDDARKNADLWTPILAGANAALIRLFLLAVLRAQKAVEKWSWDTANRKATLAISVGWVHGDKWNLEERYNISSDTFVAVGERSPLAAAAAVARVVAEALVLPFVPTKPAAVGLLYRVKVPSGANLRKTPNSAGKKITAFPKGTNVRVLKKASTAGWVEVAVEKDGKSWTGFMSANLLGPVEEAAPAPAGPCDEEERIWPRAELVRLPGDIRIPIPFAPLPERGATPAVDPSPEAMPAVDVARFPQLNALVNGGQEVAVTDLGVPALRDLAIEVQTRLEALGFLEPPVDGKFGPLSRHCLEDFHHALGWTEQEAVLDRSLALELLKSANDRFFPVTLDDSLGSRIYRFMKSKGHWFSRVPGHVNIVYIEGVNADGTLNPDHPNHFNDRRLVLTIERGRPTILGNWEATTEPGKYWTEHPMNPKGAARIAFGQYSAWTVGYHHWNNPNLRHEALIQSGVIRVYRDRNMDYDRRGDEIDEGDSFAVNQHWGYDNPRENLGRSSAGCLVGRSTAEHRIFMSLVKGDPRFEANKGYQFMTTVLDGQEFAAATT